MAHNYFLDMFEDWLRLPKKGSVSYDDLKDAITSWTVSDNELWTYVKRNNIRKNEFKNSILEFGSINTRRYIWRKYKKGNPIKKNDLEVLLEGSIDDESINGLYDNIMSRIYNKSEDPEPELNSVHIISREDIDDFFDDRYSSIINEGLEKIVKISPVLGQLSISMISSSNRSQKALQNQKKFDLEVEQKQQEIENLKAKTAQELAIAERIHTSDNVEIEEFYEADGQAGVGVASGAQGSHVGANAKGSKVTKRIVRFRGISNKDSDS